jgi:hypothetical protein
MRHWRWYERAARAFLQAVVALAVILTPGHLFRSTDARSALESRTSWGAIAGLSRAASATPLRPTFSYSVIAGGARDARELQRAVEQDPVVADHYRDADVATMRPEILRSDRLAYVSYRVGDRVFWTKRKVRIRSGETILTNGQTEIRARCGNCISMEPLLPTSDEEPDPAAFDALTDTGPVLVAWNWTEFRPSVMGGALLEDAADSEVEVKGESSLPISLFPFGPSFDSPPATSPPGAVPDLPFLDDTMPPGGFPDSPLEGMFPPVAGGLPGSEHPVGNPNAPILLVLEPLLRDSSLPPRIPQEAPPELSPVPEPGTFLLLGGGIAGLLARRVALKRARARSSSIAS